MSNSKDKSDYIDISAILRQCRQKWYVFAASLVLCVGVAFLYLLTHNSEYMVKANLIITSDSSDSSGAMGGLGSLFGSSASVDDELYTVSSHTVLREVVKELNLNKSHITKTGFLQHRFDFKAFPVDVVCNPAISDTLRMSLVFKVKVDGKGLVDVKVKTRGETIAEVEDAKFPVVIKSPFGEFSVVATPDLVLGEDVKTTIVLCGYDKAAEDLAQTIDIYVANRKADVISMELISENIDYARAVLDTLIRKYNLRGVEQDNAKHQKTLDFLNKRLELLSTDLSAVEGEIQDIKNTEGIVDMQAEAEYQFTKKGKLEAELVTAETQYEIVKLVRSFLADPANATSLVPQGLVNQSQGESSGDAINAYNDLVLQRMRIAQTASPDNQALKAIDRQLEAMRGNLITSLDKSIETAEVSLKELRGKFGSANAALGNLPGHERVMRDILRQRTIKEQLYIFLLKERERVSMLLANATDKGQIIDEAYALNEEVGMSNKMVLLVSAFIGVLLALAIIYLQNLLRTKFATREELEELTSAPLLGEMCIDRSGNAHVVKEQGSSSAAELFRLIRSNMLFMLDDAEDKVVLMTSTKSGEGKSFISINLASSLAIIGKKVLLIGLDIRNPRLAEYLGLPSSPGFTDYIAGGKLQIDQIIRRDAVTPGMDILVAGSIPPNPSELLISPKVDEFFAKIRQMYDFIIVDSAPVGMVSDTLSLVRVSDATIYVCRANYTTKADIRFFTDLYENKRLPKVSLVLNGTAAKQGYGYGAKAD